MQKAADPNRFAQDLFQPLPRHYDHLEELLSFGQNRRWRREMVAHVDTHDPTTFSTSQPVRQASHSSSPGAPARTSPASTSLPRCCVAARSASPAPAPRTEYSSSAAEPSAFPFPIARSMRSRSPICSVTWPIPPRRSVNSRESSTRARLSQVWSSASPCNGSGGSGGGSTRVGLAGRGLRHRWPGLESGRTLPRTRHH